MPATLPGCSPERGAEASHIIQGLLLIVAGVYDPVVDLPRWLQPLSVVSPATYALNATRKLIGIGDNGELGAGAPLSACAYELTLLTLMGAVSIPLGLYVFSLVERWAKHTGKLKRTG
jgi:ABC-2 type transport system permease protein